MDIVEELRQNRESGAKRLVSEYKAGLLSIARRFYKNESDAEELVNITFAKVVENIDDYLEQSAFFAWMCQILTNEFKLSVRRKSNKMELYPGVMPEVEDEYAQESIYANLDASLLRDAIEQLPKDVRKTLMMHYFMDLSVKDVARLLAIPVGTVKWRLLYARQILAAKLGVAADKAKDAMKKPGVKATLLVLALCALTAAGAAVTAAVHGGDKGGNGSERTANGETGETSGSGGVSPVATTTTPVPPDSPVPLVPDVPSTTLSGVPTMNATTLRTLAASAAIAAAGAAMPANATADIAWPSGLDAQVAALAASALPSGDSAAFGTENAFDSNGAVVRRTDGFGAVETPFDSVGSVVRFTAGSNLVTTQFPFYIIVR